MTRADELLDSASTSIRAGQLDAAQNICRNILAFDPNHVEAIHLLGVIEASRGKHADALGFFRRVLALTPRHGGCLLNQGVSYKLLGQNCDAAASFKAAIAARPDLPEAHNNFANIAHESGETEIAIGAWQKAIELRPSYPEARRNLAVGLMKLGRWNDALSLSMESVRQRPSHAQSHCLVGDALVGMHHFDKAVDAYRRALELGLEDDSIRPRLAHALRLAGRVEESLAEATLDLSLRVESPDAHIQMAAALGSLGRAAEAEAHIRLALHLRPNDPEACTNLAHLLAGRRKYRDAIEWFSKALHLEPTCHSALFGMARSMMNCGLQDDSEKLLLQAIATSVSPSEAWSTLGEVLAGQGRLEEAQAAFRQSLILDPKQPAVHSSLLFALVLDPHQSAAEVLSEHIAWAERHGSLEQSAALNEAGGFNRRLRVGYLSSDMMGHVVMKFFAPVLACHDPSRFHAICYADILTPDNVTRQLHRNSENWRSVRGKTDEEVCELIRKDGIDILVDLAGHTGTRLGVFARRAAPVQLAWLGYPATTGLRAMDFFLADGTTMPPGQECNMVEQVIRLPDCFACFAPPVNAPAIATAPCSSGVVTFGSTHKLAKLNDTVLDLWCRTIREIPHARLLIYRDCLRGGTVDRLRRMLVERGLTEGQFITLSDVDRRNYLDVYAEIDVLFDVWPWSGHATACESIWQGVPVLTRLGSQHAGRMVASVMTQIGLDSYVAASEAEFLLRAKAIASDTIRIAHLRQNLRTIVRNSPICKPRRFTAALEQAFRDVWSARWNGQTRRV